jgi:hypothetical protein
VPAYTDEWRHPAGGRWAELAAQQLLDRVQAAIGGALPTRSQYKEVRAPPSLSLSLSLSLLDRVQAAIGGALPTRGQYKEVRAPPSLSLSLCWIACRQPSGALYPPAASTRRCVPPPSLLAG